MSDQRRVSPGERRIRFGARTMTRIARSFPRASVAPYGRFVVSVGYSVKLTDLKAYSAFCPLPKLLILHSNAARFRLQIPRILLNLTAPSPAFVRELEGTCCIERFFKTLKEQILWVRHFRSIRNWFTPLRSSALFTTDPG